MTERDLLAELQASVDGARAIPGGTGDAGATNTGSEGEDTRDGVPMAQTRSQPVAPKGSWQQPHPTLTECTRHRNLCAYRQGDPDRCDACHASWMTIADWQETRDGHLAQHARDDEYSAKKAASRVRRVATDA